MTDWLLVPREPTEEMNTAFSKAIYVWLSENGDDTDADVFKGIAAAAPKKEPFIWYNFVSEEIRHAYSECMDDTWIPLYDLKD